MGAMAKAARDVAPTPGITLNQAAHIRRWSPSARNVDHARTVALLHINQNGASP